MRVFMGNKMVLVLDRNSEEAREFDTIVKILSSTSAQPFYGVNFLDGKAIGGKTMSRVEVDGLIVMAKKSNCNIEGSI